MPKQNEKVKTIADFRIDNENNSPNVLSIANVPSIASSSSLEGKTNYSNSELKGAASSTIPNVYHIPTLHNDTYAKELLNRVVQEFLPILQRRHYNVLSISELCCCNDGLDFQHEHDALDDSNHPTTKSKRKRRKIRQVADNIWGYNRTTFGNHRKQHTIHIRLRHTNDHTKFLLYEDVAGTLAHELSHCEYGPHDAKFFKLMDDLLEEHANLMYNHLTTGGTMTAPTVSTTSIIPFSGTGQKLGSGSGQRLGNGVFPGTTNTDIKHGIAGAPGQILGGDRTFVQWMSPKDAAVIAAETRRRQQLLRLRGDHDCCRPCFEDDNDDDGCDMEGKNESNVADMDDGVVSSAVTKRSKVKQHSNDRGSHVNVKHDIMASKVGVVQLVDLTELDDDTFSAADTATTTDILQNGDHCKVAAPVKTTTTTEHSLTTSQWSCHRCTYRNRPLALVCEICSTTREILL